MKIHAIAYYSSLIQRHAPPDAMDRLLLSAREFNLSCGVTGVLLHHDGNFFQYLEGPEEAVKTAYDRVIKSKTHHGIVEILNAPVSERHFTTWSMGFAEPTSTEIQRISQASWKEQLDELTNAPTDSPGLVLLLSFWESCHKMNLLV